MALIVRETRVHPTAGRAPAPVDIRVVDERIAAIVPAGDLEPAAGDTVLEAGGRLLSPPLVDPHVHLDAVLTVGEPRHNVSGTLIEGILTWAERKKDLTHEDVKDRARPGHPVGGRPGDRPDPLATSMSATPTLVALRDPARAARGGP